METKAEVETKAEAKTKGSNKLDKTREFAEPRRCRPLSNDNNKNKEREEEEEEEEERIWRRFPGPLCPALFPCSAGADDAGKLKCEGGWQKSNNDAAAVSAATGVAMGEGDAEKDDDAARGDDRGRI